MKTPWPTQCSQVTHNYATPKDKHHRNWQDGDLVWNPKTGEGHIIKGTRICGEGWYCGYCGMMMNTPTGGCGQWVRCECGHFDPGDHHGYTLRCASSWAATDGFEEASREPSKP